MEKSLRSDFEIDMALLTSMTVGTPRTQSRTLMAAHSVASEFDLNLPIDPEAHADQAREIEAVAVEIEAEMSDGDRTALIEHDSLSKSRTCPAESVGPISKI